MVLTLWNGGQKDTLWSERDGTSSIWIGSLLRKLWHRLRRITMIGMHYTYESKLRIQLCRPWKLELSDPGGSRSSGRGSLGSGRAIQWAISWGARTHGGCLTCFLFKFLRLKYWVTFRDSQKRPRTCSRGYPGPQTMPKYRMNKFGGGGLRSLFVRGW
jgi:hypothetical protein